MKEYCVYIYRQNGKAIYVGKTSNLKKRDATHKREKNWYELHDSLEYAVCGSDAEAFALEAQLIKQLDPKFNIAQPKVNRVISEFEFLDVDISNQDETPAQQAKAAGLKSLSTVSELTGVSLQTLGNWHKNKPQLFQVVLMGCVAVKEQTNV
jgi:predicted GIY-YIG superfamily endonuclease